MDFKWLRKVPLIRLLIPFIIGIFFEMIFDFELKFFFPSLFVLSTLLVFFIFSEKISESYNLRWIFGGTLSILFLFLGIYITDLHKVSLPDVKLGETVTFTGRIIENPTEKQKSVKTIIEFISVADSSDWVDISGKSLVYFAKDSLSLNLSYGDEIVFNTTINEVENLGNPYEFDFKKYLKNRDISTQIYVASGKWEKLRNTKKGFLKYYAQSVNKYLLSIYKKYDFDDKELAVLAALTIGYTADLDDETKQAFSTTGAMHILSVSGLHVGVVYMVINFLFGLFKKWQKRKIFRIFFSICSLWAFALISGFSPSVIRAATMFSLMLVAELINRDKNIYNIIGTSALIMLVCNPFVIMDVGFQLSYVAVLSIIFFQPLIYNSLYIKNKLGDKVWALLSVSIAAQLGTMPLGLYYFHQFPNYFFITNVVAVPLSSLILYVSIGFLAISFSGFLAKIVAFVLNYIVKALNFSIFFIDKLPWSSTKDIFFTFPQMILMYVIIFGITIFIIKRKKIFLKISLVSLLAFLLINTYFEVKSLRQNSIVVYNVKNACSINLISGKQNVLLCDTTVFNNDKTISFIFNNNWINRKVSLYKMVHVDSINYSPLSVYDYEKLSFKDEFVMINDKRILIMREKTLAENISNQPLDLDYIILSKNIYISIDDLYENFNFEKIIFDSSNKPWRIERWKEECLALGIDYYSVPDSGAFVLDL